MKTQLGGIESLQIGGGHGPVADPATRATTPLGFSIIVLLTPIGSCSKVMVFSWGQDPGAVQLL